MANALIINSWVKSNRIRLECKFFLFRFVIMYFAIYALFKVISISNIVNFQVINTVYTATYVYIYLSNVIGGK